MYSPWWSGWDMCCGHILGHHHKRMSLTSWGFCVCTWVFKNSLSTHMHPPALLPALPGAVTCMQTGASYITRLGVCESRENQVVIAAWLQRPPPAHRVPGILGNWLMGLGAARRLLVGRESLQKGY